MLCMRPRSPVAISSGGRCRASSSPSSRPGTTSAPIREGAPGFSRSGRCPQSAARPNLVCYVNPSQQPAACLDFAGPQGVNGVVSQTTRYPPAFYAWVGFPARLVSAGPPALYVMRLAAVGLVAALVASAVVTLRRVCDFSFVPLAPVLAPAPPPPPPRAPLPPPPHPS